MEPTTRQPDGVNRRTFLQGTLAAGAGLAGIGISSSSAIAQSAPDGKPDLAHRVAIIFDAADPVASSPPAQWAIGRLKVSLKARGIGSEIYHSIADAPAMAFCVLACGGEAPSAREMLGQRRFAVSLPDNSSASGNRVVWRSPTALPPAAESFALVPGAFNGRQSLLACGRDTRGLVYALTELADQVELSDNPLTPLINGKPTVEQPANRIRGISRLFTSDIEDKAWFQNKDFWREYLTMLVSQRFNRFNLALGIGYDFARNVRDAYFYFAYPFMLKVPGYDVKVTNLPDAERDKNLEMMRFISDEAAARGLHFQLGIWTHAYQWTDSPGVNHTITGLNAEKQGPYCRDALQMLLKECPSISGITFRIHGESGVAEGNYDFWKTVFDGIVRCGRTVEIDMHAKGIDQEMIDVGLATGMPVNVSPKSWAEHMGLSYHQAGIRPVELPNPNRRDEGFFSKSSGSRSFLRYGYGDLLKDDRKYGVLHRMWPGTQRLLQWGSPTMAAGYSRASSFCGSIGAELFEPMSFKGRKGSGLPGERNSIADASLRTAVDWEKYRYTYRVWGRLLYNPDAAPESWQRLLRKQFGPAAQAIESGLAHASRILPLITTAHCPSAANNNYWPEIYQNMSIVDASRPGPYSDTPSPKRFGTVSPLDPQLFSRMDDFADTLLKGESDAKYSPVEVAEWLADLAGKATTELDKATKSVANANDPAFRRLAVDVAIQSGIGQFFANKFRAGVLHAIYARTADESALKEAVKAYRAARKAWAELASVASSVYVHNITYGAERQLQGHWLDRLPAIDQDIAAMEAHIIERPATQIEKSVITRTIKQVLDEPTRPNLHVEHTAPTGFKRGEAIAIQMKCSEAKSVKLMYRHTNQAEGFHSEEMTGTAGSFAAAVPGAYTNSPYPVQYYFDVRDAMGAAMLYPGLGQSLSDQPYFVVSRSV